MSAVPAELRDDVGARVAIPRPPRRVVSIVPSLTEAVAVSAPGRLVAATDWCSHPAELDVVRIGGTKNPDVAGIVALQPDVVVANEEENRGADLDALRAAGIPVWVTAPRTLAEALTSLTRMLAACGIDRPQWIADARIAWAAVEIGHRHQGIVPIWRRPWMVLGRDTFAGDLLARLGVDNVYAEARGRYPKVPLAELQEAGADLVVLPDEPYAFTADDGPEAFPGIPAALVSGRHLTWYGPSLVTARDVLLGQLAAAAPAP